MPPATRLGVRKALTGLDGRIEAATGTTVDALWDHHDRGLLDEPVARLVRAHRALAKAHTDLAFHRTLLQRLASGEFELDAALLARVDRVVGQIKGAVAVRDTLHAEAVTALEPVERNVPTARPDGLPDVNAPDYAALLAIARGAKLHQHLLTGRLSVATESGTRITQYVLERLEQADLVVRDTSHPIHAGQPVLLTETGRAVLAGARGPRSAPTGSSHVAAAEVRRNRQLR
ncbi:hypothetical protein [Streptomyces sp. NBC_01244]|uniref:hypothetical protein n=1 Tax=Streptomyces sp. NBC_01244 TaxID=2903797 RepID=UPI002E0EF710|nr:hypothetical protein OG247_31870 [Streptomyces sp. NBC_01244]